LVPWLREPQVTHMLGEVFIPADIQAEADVADLIECLYQEGHDFLLGIVLWSPDETAETDRLIGVAEIHHLDLRNRQASFGIVIGDMQEWGKGYGAAVTTLLCEYAFSGLEMHRMWLHVDEHNERAIRAYEKVGFQREGLLRQDRYTDGGYHNTVVMAVLREEWQRRSDRQTEE
jgi:RimJ/RimL family protein N-acetyltransferase